MKNLSTIKFITTKGLVRVLEGKMVQVQPYLCRLGTVTMVEQIRDNKGRFSGKQFTNIKLDSILIEGDTRGQGLEVTKAKRRE